jgi:hypothetical protein
MPTGEPEDVIGSKGQRERKQIYPNQIYYLKEIVQINL